MDEMNDERARVSGAVLLQRKWHGTADEALVCREALLWALEALDHEDYRSVVNLSIRASNIAQKFVIAKEKEELDAIPF